MSGSSTRPYVWLNDEDGYVLDQVLLSHLDDQENGKTLWIAECGTRQGCFAGGDSPEDALAMLREVRESYDEHFGPVDKGSS